MASPLAPWTSALRPPSPNRKWFAHCVTIPPARTLQTSLSYQEKNTLHLRVSRIRIPSKTNSWSKMIEQLRTFILWPAICQSNPPDPPDTLDLPDGRDSPTPIRISSHLVQSVSHDSPGLLR
ncbi:unnamed protein product [Arabis nemorensis]|uniref:Uncharacterized protein n=1 Tax=Arabis nemorensis TaxID=586526 RepID=A0A565CEF0_9BRAS|nr:unnamed protein product [Arabis nemorensis]